jgi:DNA polymerase-3 subunit beta
MKFIVNTSALLEKLQTVIGTIASKPILPILDHFLFQIEGNTLTITTTDLETSMSTQMEVDADGDISVAVPSRLTLDTLKALPNQPITFDIDESSNFIEIKSEYGRYKLHGQSGEDFPKIPEVESENAIEFSSATLLQSITKTIFSTGNDDLRLNLTGVYVQLFEDHVIFAATDANRLVRLKRTDVKPGIEHSFILPKKALNLLKSTLPDDDLAVNFEYNNSNAFFSFGEVKLICRFIDERYPDYNAVIPDQNPNSLEVSIQEFTNAVKRISIFSSRSTHQLRLKIAGSEIQISAEDTEMANEATERMACVYEGSDMEIGFNGKLLLDILNHIDSDTLRVELSEPSRAALFLPKENDENEDVLMLLMPMMINATS